MEFVILANQAIILSKIGVSLPMPVFIIFQTAQYVATDPHVFNAKRNIT